MKKQLIGRLGTKQVTVHTPGEWEWKQTRGNNIFEHRVYTDHYGTIAELGMYANNESEVPNIKANAALIASAPKLAQALQDLINLFEDLNSNSNSYPELKTAKKVLSNAIPN